MKQQKLYIRSTFNYDGFPEYIDSLGVDTEQLRLELGLEKAIFVRQANIVDWNAICTFFERAAADIGDDLLGLRSALNAKADFSSIAPVIYIGALSGDVWSFFKTIANSQSVRTNGLVYNLHENTETDEVIGSYVVDGYSAPHRQFIENNMGIAALTARKLIPGFKVKYVSFTHKGPSDRSLYEEVFNAPVYFGQKENRLASNKSYFGLKGNQLSVGFRDFALKAYFKGQTELKPDAQRSISKFIEAVLPSIMGLGLSDVESFAKSLNVHSKKLQRLLKDEGMSYSKIIDSVRQELAESYLVNTNLPIVQIARLLDYSSDRPFSSAFKRWYGISPTQFRKDTVPQSGVSELFSRQNLRASKKQYER